MIHFGVKHPIILGDAAALNLTIDDVKIWERERELHVGMSEMKDILSDWLLWLFLCPLVFQHIENSEDFFILILAKEIVCINVGSKDIILY